MADKTSSITIAFAGAGETTEANIEALLNDYLGFGEEQDDGYYEDRQEYEEINLYFPASKDHSNQSLDKVVAWTAKANLPFFVAADEEDLSKPDRKMKATLADAEEVKEVADVNTELIEVLKDAEGEAYLVLLWGDDEDTPSDSLYDLLEMAVDAGIVVKDLTAGLDDIKVTDDPPANAPDPEPEPEPEPEKPTRRRRGAKAEEQKVAEEELSEASDKARAEAAEAKEKGEAKKAEVLARTNAKLASKTDLPHDRQSESSLDTGSVLVQVDDLTQVLAAVAWAADYLAAVDTSNAYVNLSDEVKPRPLTEAVIASSLYLQSVLNAPSEAAGSTESDEQGEVGDEGHPDSPAARKSRGRPRKDGTPAQPKDADEPTISVFEDEDGNLTKAGRGRPPKGQKRLKISENAAREAGLID